MAQKEESKKQEVEQEPIVEEVNATEETQEAEEVQAEEIVEEEVKDDLTLALEKGAELNDKYLRLQAEFDNYRKRTLKERVELTKTAGEKVIISTLPIMDDFERALPTMDGALDVEIVKEGVTLIYSKFQAFLKANGVVAIETENSVLDTDKHDAITQIPAPSKKMKGKIIDCVEKGYTLNDKVIRHSKVIVGQ